MFCEIIVAGKYETGNKTNQMTIVRMSVKTRKRQILNLKRFSKHGANMGMTTRRKKRVVGHFLDSSFTLFSEHK